MASVKGHREPIAIFEDAHTDASSASEGDDPFAGAELTRTHTYDSDEASEHRDHFFADDEDIIVSTHGDDEDLDSPIQSSVLPNADDPFAVLRPSPLAPRRALEDEPVRSIENTREPHKYQESFSTTSHTHIDDQRGPHLNNFDETQTPDENATQPFADGTLVKYGYDSRKVSEATSAFPEELEYYRSSLPGRAPLVAYENRSTQRTPQTAIAYGPHHSRSNSSMRHDSRPYFRSPSSVRAMQMSSPPPFSGAPVSSGRKRLSPRRVRQSNSPFVTHSRDGTPTRRVRPKADLTSDTKSEAEFPLVLLHCTLHLINEPAGYSSEALEAVGASDRVKRDAALLRSKLDGAILDRGVLIPHPREDYELLEDRVLESLELRKPRLGACGHFRRVSSSSQPQSGEEERAEGEETKEACAHCSGHLAHHLLGWEEQQNHRRWEIKVYAANGLMRSAAWSAAWREMEKVDVEVGVWLGPDDSGLAWRLEEWTRQKEQEEATQAEEARRLAEQEQTQQIFAKTQVPEMPTSTDNSESIPMSASAAQDLEDDRPSTTQSRSPKVGSSEEVLAPLMSETVNGVPSIAPESALTPIQVNSINLSNTATPVQDPSSESSGPDRMTDPPTTNRQLPLSTLVTNYLSHLFHRFQPLVFPLLILALAVYISTFDVFGRQSFEDSTILPPVPTISPPAPTISSVLQPAELTLPSALPLSIKSDIASDLRSSFEVLSQSVSRDHASATTTALAQTVTITQLVTPIVETVMMTVEVYPSEKMDTACRQNLEEIDADDLGGLLGNIRSDMGSGKELEIPQGGGNELLELAIAATDVMQAGARDVEVEFPANKSVNEKAASDPAILFGMGLCSAADAW